MHSKIRLIVIVVGLLGLMLGWPMPVRAAPGSGLILIIELQTASIASPQDKFVTLFNQSEQTVDMTGWQLQYRGARATGDALWRTVATLNCELADEAENQSCRVQLAPHQRLWCASYDLGPERPSHDLKSAMAIRGGQVRLIEPAQAEQPAQVHDMVGYGTAQTAAGDQPAPAPPKGKSLKRRQDGEGLFIDTQTNGADFFVEDEQPVVTDPPSPPLEPPAPVPSEHTPQTYPTVEITELLPRPTDGASHSFIELYNPHDEPVALEGYELQTGSHWKHHYRLPGLTLAPHSYVALDRSQTKLVLGYRSGAARLLNPIGEVISESQPYEHAKAGQAWIYLNGEWRWTTTPTPGSANIATDATDNTSAVSGELAGSPRKPKAKLAKTSKPVKETASQRAKSSTTKGRSKNNSKAKSQPNPPASPAAQPAQATNTTNGANFWFIGAAASLAGGYACYEYRHEVMTFWRDLRARFGRSPPEPPL